MKNRSLAVLAWLSAFSAPAHAQIVQQQALSFSPEVVEGGTLVREADRLYLLNTLGTWGSVQTFDALTGARLNQFGFEARQALTGGGTTTYASVGLLSDGFGVAFTPRRVEDTNLPIIPLRTLTHIVSPQRQVLGQAGNLSLSNGDVISCDEQGIRRERRLGDSYQLRWEIASPGACRLDFDRLLRIERISDSVSRFSFLDLATGAATTGIESEARVTWSIARSSNALLIGGLTQLRSVQVDSGATLWSQSLNLGEALLGENASTGVLTISSTTLCRRDTRTGAHVWCVPRVQSAHYQSVPERAVIGRVSEQAPLAGAGVNTMFALDWDTGTELWRKGEPANTLYLLGDEIALRSDEANGTKLSLSDPRTGAFTRTLHLDTATEVAGRVQAVRLRTHTNGIENLLLRKGSEALRIEGARTAARTRLPGANREDLLFSRVPRLVLSEPIFQLYRKSQAFDRQVLVDPVSGRVHLPTDPSRAATIDRTANGDWLVATRQPTGGELIEYFDRLSYSSIGSLSLPAPAMRAQEGDIGQFACGAEACVLTADANTLRARRLADASVLWQRACTQCSTIVFNPLRAALRGEPLHLLLLQPFGFPALLRLSPLDGSPLFGSAEAGNIRFAYDGEHFVVASGSSLRRLSSLNGLALANLAIRDMRSFDTRFNRLMLGLLRMDVGTNGNGISLILPTASVLTLDTQNYAPISETMLRIGSFEPFAGLPLVDQVLLDSAESGRVMHSGADAYGERDYTLSTVAIGPAAGNVVLSVRNPQSSVPNWTLRNDSAQTRTVRLVAERATQVLSCVDNGANCPTNLPALVTLAPRGSLEIRLPNPNSFGVGALMAFPVSHATETTLSDNRARSDAPSETLLIDGFE